MDCLALWLSSLCELKQRLLKWWEGTGEVLMMLLLDQMTFHVSKSEPSIHIVMEWNETEQRWPFWKKYEHLHVKYNIHPPLELDYLNCHLAGRGYNEKKHANEALFSETHLFLLSKEDKTCSSQKALPVAFYICILQSYLLAFLTC